MQTNTTFNSSSSSSLLFSSLLSVTVVVVSGTIAHKQAHAIIQSPRIRPFALNLPEAMGRMVDKMKAREGEGGWWEVYLPPGERGSSSLSSEAISSETPFASSSTIPLHPVTTKPPHHLPLPLPPNLFKSIAYAWKIADEALHLSAAPFALNDAGADGVGGRFEASKSDGGKDEVLRMGQGQGWEWYVRRGVLAGIYLRAGECSVFSFSPSTPPTTLLFVWFLPPSFGATCLMMDVVRWLIIPITPPPSTRTESELMRPRASTQALTLPLERARAKLDVLLEGSYEPTVRRISLRGSGREQGAGESGGGGTRRREEVGTLGRFVWKSWGGLFRSRGWIG